jgi:hypothetical protein
MAWSSPTSGKKRKEAERAREKIGKRTLYVGLTNFLTYTI